MRRQVPGVQGARPCRFPAGQSLQQQASSGLLPAMQRQAPGAQRTPARLCCPVSGRPWLSVCQICVAAWLPPLAAEQSAWPLPNRPHAGCLHACRRAGDRAAEARTAEGPRRGAQGGGAGQAGHAAHTPGPAHRQAAAGGALCSCMLSELACRQHTASEHSVSPPQRVPDNGWLCKGSSPALHSSQGCTVCTGLLRLCLGPPGRGGGPSAQAAGLHWGGIQLTAMHWRLLAVPGSRSTAGSHWLCACVGATAS